jgi:hypothetical protein
MSSGSSVTVIGYKFHGSRSTLLLLSLAAGIMQMIALFRKQELSVFVSASSTSSNCSKEHSV